MIFCPKCEIKLQKENTSYRCKKCNNKIEIDNDIYLFNPEIIADNNDYKADWLDKLYQYEKKYFWFRIRKDVIKNNFKKFVNLNDKIIEIGSGTGYVAKSLMDSGYKNYSVGDIHKNGLLYSKNYNFKNFYQFDLLKSPFIDEFDTVCMFDVLEHINNEKKAVINIHKMLKKNGRIILTVPAHMFLWSNIDEVACHKRRYNLKLIKDLLMKNGFKILIAKHFFCLILPFLYMRTLLNKKNEDFDEKKSGIKINYIINSFFYVISWIENIFLICFSPRIGGSIIVIGEKK